MNYEEEQSMLLENSMKKNLDQNQKLENGYDCYHAALHEVCKLYHVDYKPYELFFLNKLCHGHKKLTNSSHLAANTYDSAQVFENLNKEIFKVKLILNLSEEELREELNRKHKVLVMIENSNLDYDSIYARAKIKHHCIIIKSIDVHSNLFIIDPYILIHSYKIKQFAGYIEANKILNACNYAIVFENVKREKSGQHEIVYGVYRAISEYLQNESRNNELENYLNSLRDIVLYNEEKYEEECLYTAAALESNPYISMLAYLQDLLEEYSVISDGILCELYEIIESWKKKKMQFQKIGVSRKKEKLVALVDDCISLKNKQDIFLQDLCKRLVEV